MLQSGRRDLLVIDKAQFSLSRREALGIVGESGSGKSMLCRSLVGTLDRYGGRATAGSIRWKGQELVGASERVWRSIRGKSIGYVPQSSLAGLNPLLPVGRQLEEAIGLTGSKTRPERVARSLELLDLVRIPRADRVLKERAESLSGGMRQRVIIAAALAPSPELLILDEPTTALDVTVQAEILNLINQLRSDLGTAVILVSHDMSVIEMVADRVATMYAGAIVEDGRVAEVRNRPRHPYTSALLSSRFDTAIPGEDLITIQGEPPSVGSWPTGCRFWPRCPIALEDCKTGCQPELRRFDGYSSACILEW